jgi:hypothetical protein
MRASNAKRLRIELNEKKKFQKRSFDCFFPLLREWKVDVSSLSPALTRPGGKHMTFEPHAKC